MFRNHIKSTPKWSSSHVMYVTCLSKYITLSYKIELEFKCIQSKLIKLVVLSLPRIPSVKQYDPLLQQRKLYSNTNLFQLHSLVLTLSLKTMQVTHVRGIKGSLGEYLTPETGFHIQTSVEGEAPKKVSHTIT